MKRLSRETPRVAPGLVHLGLGAFSRAHLAIYTETAQQASGGDWGVVGVSLRSPDTRDALAPQDFAYTAVQRGPDGPVARRVEIVSDVLVAAEDAARILHLMSDPAIRIVSLTVTEKGYCRAQAQGRIDLDHPDVRRDLTEPLPVSAPGYIVRALQARRAAGHPPFTVLSCDNLPENGRIVRGVVLDLAHRLDPGLADWIAETGRFPSTMVDRIVPATKPADIADVEALTGMRDAAPVVHEPFAQWVIEDDFVDGARPDWTAAGAELAADVRPFETMKLRMLNGTHSALAYLGYLAGFDTIADTVADPDFAAFTRLVWRDEIVPTLTAPPGVDLPDYADQLLARYANAGIRHRTWQIAMDGSQKLPQRILATLADHADPAGCPGLILAVAGWMRYVGGVDETGAPIDVRDPMAARLATLARSSPTAGDRVTSLLSVREVFAPALAERIADPLARAYGELLDHGAHASVRRMVEGSRT